MTLILENGREFSLAHIIRKSLHACSASHIRLEPRISAK